MWWEYLRVNYEDRIYVNTLIGVVLPPKQLLKYYESHKLRFQSSSYEDKLRKIKNKYIKSQPKAKYPMKCLGKCGNTWNAKSPNPKKCPYCSSIKLKKLPVDAPPQ